MKAKLFIMKTKLFICLVLFSAIMQAQTIYVSSDGDNTNGSSWAKAYSSIQAALAVATSGNEIWVKQGTYVIASEAEQLNFKSGVNVYGGFLGTEATRADRSTNPALTIISQDTAPEKVFRLLTSVALDDLTTWDGFTFDGKNIGSGVLLSGNCKLENTIVANCKVTDGSGAGVRMSSSSALAPAILKNTTVKDNTINVGGASYFGGGAGISAITYALIENCIISGNKITVTTAGSSSVFGAGIYIVEGEIKNSIIDGNILTGAAGNNITGAGIAIVPAATLKKVLIEGCSITNNSSPARGGAILIDPRYSGQYLGDYTIKNTNIINNNSNSVGGGIFSTAATVQTTGLGWKLNVINSVIANNTATTGAGMFINNSGSVNITYSTFANNKATTGFGGGGIQFAGQANQTINATLTNVLLWGNKESVADTQRTQFNNNNQTSITQHSAIQDYIASSSYWTNATRAAIVALNAANTHAVGPKFLDPATIVGYDAANAATLTNAAKWQITSGSACIEAGTDANDNDGNLIVTDYAGTTRPNSSSFTFPDIGAYQFDPANPPTLNLKDIVKSEAFQIYPTITNSIINIKSTKGVNSIEIFSMNGTSVLKTNALKQVNVSSLANGIYIVRVAFDDYSTDVKRFIKQ
jgi:hypothetical protein